MAEGSFRESIDQWKQQYQLLLDQASTLLRNFDANSSDGGADLIARRQQIMGSFQTFEEDLKSRLAGWGASEQGMLEEFRSFQKEITAKILEIDALAIALASERMEALKRELAGLSRRRTVCNAYEGGASLSGRR